MTDTVPASDSAEDTSASELNFDQMALSKAVLKAVKDVGYETPSPIQAQSIPPLLEGRDLLGIAQTGTGKTAAFALPLISRIDTKTKHLQILCLTPTRELAIQVAEAFQGYARHVTGFRVIPIYGGADIGAQLRHLKRGVQVVVGTPGRVMDHMRRGSMVMDNIQALVLDEADEMLRMGFQEDVEWILEHMPPEPQIALFSATMPAQVKKIAKTYLKDPSEITIKVTHTDTPAIRQRYVPLRNIEKLDYLTRILDVEEVDAALVFVRTRHATSEIAEKLKARGYDAEALSGDITQSQREKIVSRLRNGKIDIIIATDVAARGLDVTRITHVLNYDVPYDTESYVHRIGRTGRAGREGDAILFVNGRERRMLHAFEKATRQTIDVYAFPSADILNDRKITQLFARLDSELEKDLKEYSSVISKYLEHNEVDPMLLAAAFASLEGDSQPFYFKDPPKKSHKQKARDDREQRSATREERQQADEGMETFRIEVGKKNKVNTGDIVGAIANEAGLDAQHIGKIFIFNDFSVVDLPKGMPHEVFDVLKKVKVRGRSLNISRDKGGKGGARRRAVPGKSDFPNRKRRGPPPEGKKKRKPKKKD